jgi:hypothetical protein
MRGRSLFATVLVLACLSRVSYSLPISSLDVAALAAAADLIVVGQVKATDQQGSVMLNLAEGSVAATRFRGRLRADRVLKGDVGADVVFDYLVPDVAIGFQGVTAGQYGVFFLKGGQGRWSFLDPTHPTLPAVENAPLPPGSALDQITAMLGLVLQSPQASEANAVQALYALGRLRTELADQTLKGALKGSSGAMRLNIARTLVARNDLTGLEAVSTALLNPKDLSPQLVSNLAGSLAGLKDPNAVPTLSVLIGTGNTEVQRGAAAALRQSSSPAALEPLSRLLNSSDLQTRYYAVIGLGEITGQNEWAPAFDEFQLHEDHYLLYWQNWARVNLH